jgi:hypothetical protein
VVQRLCVYRLVLAVPSPGELVWREPAVGAVWSVLLLFVSFTGDWTIFRTFALLLIGFGAIVLLLLWSGDGARYPGTNVKIGLGLTALVGVLNCT